MIRKIILGLCFVSYISLQALAQKVERVVSLTPSITENIYLIGAKNKLVGCTSYCKVAVDDGVQQVGSAVNVNVEKVFSLRPDLVLTMGLTKPQDVATLEKLGIKVEVIQTPENFEELCEQTLYIAELIGNTEQAQRAVSEAKTNVGRIKKESRNKERFTVFFQIGSNPIFTVLQNTFMDDYITFCNGENIAAGMQHGTITREGVLVKNPDVILLTSMGGFGEEEMGVWQKYTGITAVKNNKVFLVNQRTACSPTPKNFASALTEIYNNIYK